MLWEFFKIVFKLFITSLLHHSLHHCYQPGPCVPVLLPGEDNKKWRMQNQFWNDPSFGKSSVNGLASLSVCSSALWWPLGCITGRRRSPNQKNHQQKHCGMQRKHQERFCKKVKDGPFYDSFWRSRRRDTVNRWKPPLIDRSVGTFSFFFLWQKPKLTGQESCPITLVMNLPVECSLFEQIDTMLLRKQPEAVLVHLKFVVAVPLGFIGIGQLIRAV